MYLLYVCNKYKIGFTHNHQPIAWPPFCYNRVQFFFTGHARTRLLIYQCGINGVYEALYHGVPIICLPIFFDQFDNAQRVASRGIGLRLDITTLTSDQLVNAVNTVLGDQK